MPQVVRNPVQFEVGLELPVDDIGGQQERPFPQLRQLLGANRLGGGRFRRRPADAGRGKRVDDDHLVSRVDEALRHRLGAPPSGHPLDELLLFVDELEVERGADGDAGVEQVLDVQVSLRAMASRRVVVGQAVDEDHLGAAREHRRDVDHRDAIDQPRRHALDAGRQRSDLRCHRRLECGHDHVLASLTPPPGFVEHAKRLADT